MSKLSQILGLYTDTDEDLINAEADILAWVDEVIGSNELAMTMPEGLGQSFRGDGKPYTEIAIENRLRDKQRKRARS